jgi:signal transduction histidine kinase
MAMEQATIRGRPLMPHLYVVLGAIVVVVMLMVGAVFASSQLLEEMRVKGRHATAESFAIGKMLQQRVVTAKGRLLKLALGRQESEWTGFQADWKALADYVDTKEFSSAAEAANRDRFIVAGAEFHQAAEALHSAVAAGADPASLLNLLPKLDESAGRMIDEASELASAHRTALRDSLNTYMVSLGRQRKLLLGALGLLVLLGGILGVTVQRQLIAPLQVKLVEREALLERQEKLASLGVLAAGVAHEIRNPLTAIKAWLFMQTRRLQPGTQEHADAEIVSEELARLERIVRDFLTFARPSEPQLQVVPAVQPLREVRDLLARPLEAAGVRLEVAPSADASICVDPQQIKQVLINLVRNGAESIGGSGEVTLRARADRARLGGEDTAAIVLEVADTGRGISPEVERRLFDPFFSTKETGTGLGLSIAARIVEKHGGLLQYRTEVNRGTTFGVVLRRSVAT